MTTKKTKAGEACSSCGGLMAVEVRPARRDVTGLISHVLNPEPAADVGRIHCAGCGAVLWEWDNEEVSEP